MATINPAVFQSSANLSLWFKVRGGDALTLTDVPEIIPLRWTYFRDSWSALKRRLSNLAESQSDPDSFRATLQDLDQFLSHQRLISTDTNPFTGSDIYHRFYPVFDALKIEDISLTNEEKELLAQKKAAVQAFSKNDFLKMKQDIASYRDYLADGIGLGDPDYNRIHSRQTVARQVDPSIADLNVMLVLQKQLASIDFILANMFAVDASVDPFALARSNANNPEISIGQYSSGYLVRMHYGENLQDLANRHLKDPNKWIDIAIANGLREPYVDEVGEQIAIISNGRGNQINIASLDLLGNPNINKFYVNQAIFLQSNTIPFPSLRLINAIKEIPVSGEIVLTLSGTANLDSYLLSNQANIRVFKPHTVNSSQFVLIPTSSPLDTSRQDEVPWFQTSSQADEKKTKIDLAIGDRGELQFTPNGDLALSYGLANAIQATRLKLLTEKGTNRYHPTYGLINLAGTNNTNDSDTKNLLINSISEQVQADARFDRVESLNVARNTSTTAVGYDVSLVVRLAGSNTLVPISFTVTL